jgi:hypothetical protein
MLSDLTFFGLKSIIEGQLVCWIISWSQRGLI